MSTGTATPKRPDTRAGRGSEAAGQDSFAHVLRAEWTKFRTVRGWVIGMVVAALVTVLLGLAGRRGQLVLLLHSRRAVPLHPPGGAGRRGGDRQLLLRAPAADQPRQHHRAGDLADRRAAQGVGERPGPGRPGRSRACTRVWSRGRRPASSSRRAPGRGRRTRRCWSPAPRGADAVRLHRGHRRPARRGDRRVAALAAADPLRVRRSPATSRPTARTGPGSAPPPWPGCPRPCRPGCSPPLLPTARRRRRAWPGSAGSAGPRWPSACLDQVGLHGAAGPAALARRRARRRPGRCLSGARRRVPPGRAGRSR